MKLTINGFAVNVTDAVLDITLPNVTLTAAQPSAPSPAPTPTPPTPSSPPKPSPAPSAATAVINSIIVGATPSLHATIWYSLTGVTDVSVDFGDGQTSKIISLGHSDIGHSYANAGTYTVVLKAKDANGAQIETSKAVTVPTSTVAPSPAPSPSPTPAPSPAPAAPPVTPPPIPSTAGAHLVTTKVTDNAGVVWSAKAGVGDDPTVDGIYAWLYNSAGEAHPGIAAYFYADGVDIGAVRADNAYDYVNCTLEITYDGVVVPHAPSSKADGTVDFWRGCRMPTTRYGTQVVPTSADIDWTILPSYAKGTQTAFNDSKMDYKFNGLGCASTRAMGETGERDDIGYMSRWNMGFIINQSAADWAVVRRADDHAGVWPIYYCDPSTGRILNRHVYPNANTLPKAQASEIKNNPIVFYGGSYDGTKLTPPTSLWQTTACPNVPNGAHLCSYALLSAMLTKTARDRDHASFWANWTLLEINPYYTASQGVALGPQRRFAWCLRSLFMASYVSSDTAYFAAETARNLPIAEAVPQNAFGIYPMAIVYTGTGLAAGHTGMATWMQSYMSITLDAVSFKLPEWKPFTQYISKLPLQWYNYPWRMMGTNYEFMCSKDGVLLTDFSEMAYYSWVSSGWTDAEAKAMLATTTVQEAYNVLVQQNANVKGNWTGKYANGVSDFHGYCYATDSYPATLCAAVVTALNCGVAGAPEAHAYNLALPTIPDYTTNQKYHLVPRTQVVA